jgi:hypothetical protein
VPSPISYASQVSSSTAYNWDLQLEQKCAPWNARCQTKPLFKARDARGVCAGGPTSRRKKARLVNGLKIAAQIEDEQLQEDVQRHISNHQSQGITPFNLHLRAMGSDVAAARTGHKHTECGLSSLIIGKQILTLLGDNTAHQSQGITSFNLHLQAMGSDMAAAQTGHKRTECGLSSLIIGKQILTLLGDDTAHDATNDEERSERSGAEFHPPPACGDGEDLVSDGESEAPDESEKEATTKKPSSKKRKKPKPGRKNIIAVRETTAQKPAPTSTKDRLKHKADDATR